MRVPCRKRLCFLSESTTQTNRVIILSNLTRGGRPKSLILRKRLLGFCYQAIGRRYLCHQTGVTSDDGDTILRRSTHSTPEAKGRSWARLFPVVNYESRKSQKGLDRLFVVLNLVPSLND